MTKKRPDPWSQWYEYYDARPVPYPRRCKCCKKVFKRKLTVAQELKHLRDCICVTNLRSWPPYGSLDSDRWERVRA